MKAEIIAVGTELLLGQIVNTNAQFLSQQCAAVGIDVYFQTVVGDNEVRLKQAIMTAKSRAELIIFTGGLGPTQDDLTKDVLASFLDRRLLVHQLSMDKISEYFISRGMHMVESNSRQAMMIEGSEPLLNDAGMAVGNAMTVGGIHYILLPGPPNEMKPMFENYAKVWLQKIMPGAKPLYSKMLKFCGIGESALEHQIIDLINEQQDPSIAPYAKMGEVTIRLTTRASSLEEAHSKMLQTEQTIRKRLGMYLYAEVDISLEEAILIKLSEMNATLSVAESCSGGLLSDLITSIPGSSSSFRGGIICYSNELKQALLGIPMDTLTGINAPGAVSMETAQRMAEQMLKLASSDYAVSITGVAGPEPSEGKPIGLVFIAIAEKDKTVFATSVQHSGDRNLVKLKAVKTALYHLWRRLTQENN